MSLRTINAVSLCVCLLAPAVLGCSGDKIEQGRRLVDTEPEKALALFSEAVAEKGETFESLIYSGLALEKLVRESEAIEAYEKALATEGAANRPEPVAERLLALYEKRHGLTNTVEGKTAIARKAAELEKILKVARPWASTYLMEQIGEAGDEATVRKLVDEGMALAVPTEAKNRFGEDCTKALRSAFVVNAEKKFMETLAGPLAERGVYDAATSRIIFRNEFVIPSAGSSEDFNPELASFAGNVRKNTCVHIHTELSETIAKMQPVLDLKDVNPAGINVVFENLYRTFAKAGFKAFNGDKRPPNGQTYVCVIDVPLREFLSAVFVFAE